MVLRNLLWLCFMVAGVPAFQFGSSRASGLVRAHAGVGKATDGAGGGVGGDGDSGGAVVFTAEFGHVKQSLSTLLKFWLMGGCGELSAPRTAGADADADANPTPDSPPSLLPKATPMDGTGPESWRRSTHPPALSPRSRSTWVPALSNSRPSRRPRLWWGEMDSPPPPPSPPSRGCHNRRCRRRRQHRRHQATTTTTTTITIAAKRSP